MVGDTFAPGEFFIYKNGDRLELGKVKRAADDGALAYFCWYSCGTTAARTPVELMLKLTNNDGGPAGQYTLERFVATCCVEDTPLEVKNYFSERVIWSGLAGKLPPDLSFLPVEDSDVTLRGAWAYVC